MKQQKRCYGSITEPSTISKSCLESYGSFCALYFPYSFFLRLTSELNNLGVHRKILGAVVALAALALSAYLSIGLLVGILLYIAEVAVLYVLKWMYGTGENAPDPIVG
jgi:hypothetical protein